MGSGKAKSLLSVLRLLVNIAWYASLIVALMLVWGAFRTLLPDAGIPGEHAWAWKVDQPGLTLTFPGALPAPATRQFFRFSVFPTGIPAYVMLMMILHVLRKLLACSIESPFTPENASRVRTLGLLLLGNVVIRATGNLLYSRWVVENVHLPGVDIQTNILTLGGGLFTALLVLILSEVYRYGVLLQEERDLTV